MKLTIFITKTIEIDEHRLQGYAAGVRARFALKSHHPVNMSDILIQAELDGDVALPEWDEWELDGYEDDLSPDEIAELENDA